MPICLNVINGDITRVVADALITAINKEGAWVGGIDGAIARCAGPAFHKQAAHAMPLHDGQTIIARGANRPNTGAFGNVVFVVDELQRPLREVVYLGLKAASDAGFVLVTLPAIRMGVMLGVVEKSPNEAVSELAEGIHAFIADHSDTPLQGITFVIYDDTNMLSLLREAL